MPPKKGGAAKKGNAKQKEDQEFEALLKQLNTTTAKKGKEEAAKHKNEPKHITAAERKAAVRNAQKEKEEAMAKQFESRVQQNKLQEMLRELMKNGGPGGMSPFLDSPKTAIESGNASAKAPSQLNAGYAAMQGWRRDMEDAHILFPDFVNAGGENWHLFCVMDGHGGSVVAQTVKTLLPANLIKAVGDKEPSQDAFASAFSEMDKQIRKKHGQACETCGTTCVTTMISDKKVYCASVGDSRAVLARKAGTPNDVVTLAYDHKPENEGERARIEKAGGHVENNRTNGNLAMSRALGDYVYKNVAGKPMDEQLVINVPDVISAERKEGDEFVVVACDGIFDVLSNEELVAVIRDEMAKLAAPGTRLTTAQLETVSGNLTKHCLAPATAQGPARGEGSDNMSIIIVQL